MRQAHTFDPELHEADSIAARGRCSHHAQQDVGDASCAGEAVVSFQDSDDQWQSGCSLALEQLVERGEIEPLGQGG